MVALLIGLFLMGGLMTCCRTIARHSAAKVPWHRCRTGERLAMSMMTGINPTGRLLHGSDDQFALEPHCQRRGTFASSAGPAAASLRGWQGLTGATVSGSDVMQCAVHDWRGDGILNCSGGQNLSGANATYKNQFSASRRMRRAYGSWAVCAKTELSYPLVKNVTNLTVRYGR